MPRYNAASLIGMLRKRIGMEREAISILGKLDESSLRRIENEKQHPKQKTLEALMDIINLPLDGFIYSLLDEHPMEVCLLCDRLTQSLDIPDIDLATSLLASIEILPTSKYSVLHQFILSKKARLWELQGKSANQILSLIDEGMAETYESFDDSDIVGKVLVLEESELVHTKARLYAKEGEIDVAVRILEDMRHNLIKLPTSDKEKERQYAPVLLSLSDYLLKAGDYNRVLEICDLGAEYSAARKHGQLNPDFELNKSLALHRLNRTKECRLPLQHAYFGYVLLGELEKASNVLTQAKDVYKIQLNLYGVDALNFINQQKIPYNRGNPVDCDSLGNMIGILRANANLSIEQLCHGICNKSTLSRIERGKLSGQVFTMEAIMQRLGRDINLYSNFFLSKEEFVAMQLRDRTMIMLIERRFNEAANMLSELESLSSFLRHNVNQQFMAMAKALIFASKHDEPHPDFPVMLLDALKITCPQFDERYICNYNLTYNEIVIINRYASYLGDTDQTTLAADIYDRLLRNINVKYIDEMEKACMYSTILFNYSMCVGRLGRWTEALAIVTDGERFERSHKRLIDLPGFAFVRGYNMMLLGKLEECIPYFTLAYYGTSMFSKYGQSSYLPIIYAAVKEHFGIEFD
jgi:transcriptional regulator with XRE-family HTH domain